MRIVGNSPATFNVRHAEKAGDRAQEAREALGPMWKYVGAFEIESEQMIQQQMGEDAFGKICNET